MTKTILAEYRIGDKGILLMRKGKEYAVRIINHKANNCKDKIRKNYANYSYTLEEGTKEAMRTLFYNECWYMTRIYGDMNEREIYQ